MEEIFGYVESIVFSADTFTVARLKEPRKQELTCIVGPLPSVQPGETLRCSGKWKYHSQYGQQFEVESFESKQPSDLVGIQKYLESGMIKGIGPVYAEKIIKQFGINTLKIIDNDPDRLSEVAGIGPKRIDTIKVCWDQQKSIREVMLFLQTFGISPTFAHKIYKAYGKDCIQKVKEDPYVLAKDIRGIGFKYADQIALKMGLPLHSLTRIQAGIEHVLWELSNEGHTCYPLNDLLTSSAEILMVPAEEIQIGLEKAIEHQQLISYEGMISLKPFHLSEKGIVREIKRLLTTDCELRTVHYEKAILWSEEKLSITFAEEQKQAIIAAVKDKFHIITGGPGTGKSTITKAILRITEKLTSHILLAAPTGRAAKRMSEITGKKASTIHALLEMDFQSGGFKRGADNPLKCDLLIIDEASMIDTFLLFQLLKAVPSTARVILIGDIDQLPSVGAGTVLRDLIDSRCINVTKLTQIFRQAAHSKIITNAHLINQGKFPELFNTFDFRFIEEESAESIVAAIKDLIIGPKSLRSRFHIFEDVQVLSPMKRGAIGTENLNVVLQGILNPSVTPLCRMGRTFHVGDKVMQIRNDYEKLIFNGDIGRILTIDLSSQVLSINFDGRRVEYQFSEIDDLVLAYAVSIHKYQGSECPCIIIPVHMSHFKMLHRNLLYTGITRGKKMVILIGTKQAIGLAIRNDDVKKRHTQLKEQFFKMFTPT
ncbi:MAG: ATP-dependent RecD-like DNA helicase [Candidatus Rhabdochlamydia sp.]